MTTVETSPYLILLTEKAEKCSPSKVEECRLLFNNNPTVKNLFKNSINQILKEVFHQYYYEKDKYSPGESYGIYDLEMSGRSVINKLNTNYSAFSVLLRDVNKVLSASQQPIIIFQFQTTQGQINEVKRLNQFIYEYKNRIFNTTSSTFQSLMMVLNQTHSWGQKREDTTIEILKKQFSSNNIKPVGKLGSSEDMIGGVDCKITVDGVLKTAQIKPFTHCKTENGNTTVMGSGNVKRYNTNWLIFTKNNKEILIFENKNSKINEGNFVFPEQNLIYSLS
jgi:hypothetical protein